jgi:hypothetical protein
VASDGSKRSVTQMPGWIFDVSVKCAATALRERGNVKKRRKKN